MVKYVGMEQTPSKGASVIYMYIFRCKCEDYHQSFGIGRESRTVLCHLCESQQGCLEMELLLK